MRGRYAALAVLALAGGLGAGIGIERERSAGAGMGDGSGPEILYWVAPMDPNFRKDGPGKSPMGMDLIPVYEGDTPTGDPSEVRLSAAEVNAIGVRSAVAVERAVAGIPGTSSAYAERPVGGRFIEIDIDRLAAARYGLSIAEVQQVVQTAIGGQVISESVEGLERFPINLRYPRDWRDSPDRLADLPMVTLSGAHMATPPDQR